MTEPAPRAKPAPILAVSGLKKHFPVTQGTLLSRVIGWVKAVDGVSFEVARGETLGLVGESGCGKTTIGRCILRLETPTAGTIRFEDRALESLAGESLRALRRRVQVIFQDPYSSLNPRMTIGEIVGEAPRVHGVAADRRAAREWVGELLDRVGLPRAFARRYPHELSGGQRQRVGIARALSLNPSFIVCDEAVSALDVSIQAQVINLLESLQERLGLTYLFISHDLSVVRHISNRVAVMYLGKLVEVAPSAELYANPLHPYTRALLSAVPIPDPELEAGREQLLLPGEVPSPLDPPAGCVFHPRCPLATSICREQAPEYREHVPGHWAACHHA
jgi:oligopeptide transport system ATP-binding protein